MTKHLFTKLFFTFNQLILFFVSLWQATRLFRSFFIFSSCRFYPSCSDYFLEAIKKHGLFMGLVLTSKRILRCQPLCEGGVDEVRGGHGY